MFLHVLTACLQATLLSVTTFAGFGPGFDGEVTEGERSEERSYDYGLCSASSERSRTGRQWAIVWVSPREDSICLREKRGGAAPNDVPDCWKVAREELGCDKIVDIN
jgi:hypothetical protein